MSDKAQRTEKPTPQRRKRAVREGQVPRSPEISSWATLLAFTMVLPMTVGALVETFTGAVRDLERTIVSPDQAALLDLLRSTVLDILLVLAPALLVPMVVAVAANAVQGGLRVSATSFKPKVERLNVLKGLKRLVGVQAAWSLAKTLLKFVLFGGASFLLVRSVVRSVTDAGLWSLTAAVGTVADAALDVLRTVAVLGLVLAAADYVVERRRVERSIMMSPEEIKREHRQSEGDPLLKGAIRGRQREMSRNRMMADIASARVVVVNPTHVAVALAYQAGMPAPKVVAKGAGVIAARIREEAQTHHLPLVQDVPLARTLYRSCEVGQEIPAELYDAVAQLLVFVMGLDAKGAAHGVHRRSPGADGRDGQDGRDGGSVAD